MSTPSPAEAAIERFQRMLAQNPQNGLARFSLGKAHFDAGQFAAAREHLALALASKPDWMVVQILLGKCDLALGNPAAAKAALQRALALALAQHHDGPQTELEALLAEL